jgi:hypothetical protein
VFRRAVDGAGCVVEGLVDARSFRSVSGVRFEVGTETLTEFPRNLIVNCRFSPEFHNNFN